LRELETGGKAGPAAANAGHGLLIGGVTIPVTPQDIAQFFRGSCDEEWSGNNQCCYRRLEGK